MFYEKLTSRNSENVRRREAVLVERVYVTCSITYQGEYEKIMKIGIK